jgi:hypothetical protein
MLAGVSGSRHDGEPWPPAGETIAVPDWEAHDLVTGGNAVYEDDDLPVAHVGETVPASAPPGTEGQGRVFEGEASAGEVMTGHPADEAAEVRAAKDQHGLRGADEGAQTHRVSGLRANVDDPRPDSQILAEDYSPEEIERIDLGKSTMSGAKAAPAGQRRKDREAAQAEIAGRRQAERNSALRYATEGGITGAPGSEVPAGEAFPYAEGVRPASQVEAEEAIGARNEAGEDVTEPGTEGMSDLERAEFGSRVPGYTRPEEIRDEPAPGQPSLEPVPGAGTATAGTGSKARDTKAEARTADETKGGRHRVTAASESPISVSEEGRAVKPEDAEPARAGATELNDEAKAEAAGNENAPAPSATKQEWADYAVREHGMDVHEAGAMTKADLMSRFGGRL